MAGVAGVLSTTPILAIFGILIDLVGTAPAVVALVVYGILPVLGNTAAGLEQVPKAQRGAALAIALDQSMGLVERKLRAKLPGGGFQAP